MSLEKRSFPAVAQSDIILLLGKSPRSLLPISIAELHLYCYLANLVALSGGSPISNWGYNFALTKDGFPFSSELDSARVNLIDRSILSLRKGEIEGEGESFESEYSLMASLSQSNRRLKWLETALLCVLNLPDGAVRSAINNSPGVSANFRDRRVSALLSKTDIDLIYDEFSVIRQVVGDDEGKLLQPTILWLSARVLTENG